MSLLGESPGLSRSVAIVTRSPKFRRLLGIILTEWKYLVEDDPVAAKVVFAERGLDLPDGVGEVIRLTPMPLSAGKFLPTPISLSRLYHQLEEQFFTTPRHHLRVTLDLGITLNSGGKELSGRLLSLSCRGARVACCQEMSAGSSLHLEVPLGDGVQTLTAKVLYSIPAGDVTASPPQAGVLFGHLPAEQYALLGAAIEKICIENACAKAEIALNDPCLSWLDVPTHL